MVERSYNQNSSNTAPPPPIHRVPRNNREPRTRATNITTPATCLSAASPRPPGSRAISSTSNKKSLHCKQSENRACLFWEFNGRRGVCLINRSLWTFQTVLSPTRAKKHVFAGCARCQLFAKNNWQLVMSWTFSRQTEFVRASCLGLLFLERVESLHVPTPCRWFLNELVSVFYC